MHRFWMVMLLACACHQTYRRPPDTTKRVSAEETSFLPYTAILAVSCSNANIGTGTLPDGVSMPLVWCADRLTDVGSVTAWIRVCTFSIEECAALKFGACERMGAVDAQPPF